MPALCVGLGFFLADRIAKNFVVWPFFKALEAPRTNRPGATATGLYVTHDLLTAPARLTGPFNVLLLGDSTNDSSPSWDTDKRLISEMVVDELKATEIKIFSVSYPGMGIDREATLFRYLTSLHETIHVAVFPVSLRWLSPAWRNKTSDPMKRGYELYAARQRIWPWLVEAEYGSYPWMVPTPMNIPTILGEIDRKVAKLDAPAYMARFKTTLEEAQKKTALNKLALSYGFELTADDALFEMAGKIMERCHRMQIECLFYFGPQNLHYLGTMSKELSSLYRTNLSALNRYFQDRNAKRLDLTDLVPARHFSDVGNEHLDQVGRAAVASALATYLSSLRGSGASE